MNTEHKGTLEWSCCFFLFYLKKIDNVVCFEICIAALYYIIAGLQLYMPFIPFNAFIDAAPSNFFLNRRIQRFNSSKILKQKLIQK